MPTMYKRKSKERAKWSAESLTNAIDCVRNGRMGVNEAARSFGIPKSTLKDRIKNSDSTKRNRLGPSSCLGDDAELKLVRHIKKLQRFAFEPGRESVRIWAFQLAEQLKLNHKFNKEKGKAGYDWLNSFLRRHPDLSIRKAEGISTARATGMIRDTVKNYFSLLEKLLTDNELHDKPFNVFNMDNSGLQLNNMPTQVLTAKRSKNVSSLTSCEKGETISVIVCCNAEGMFLPPYSIFKGKNKNNELLDGMPPGSQIAMSEKSAYVNATICKDWLKSHFLPRKPAGTVLLIVNGNTSHAKSVEVLEFCEEHNIILLCLPNHTSHYLQPLDTSFLKSLKNNYYSACNNFLKTNPNMKITRLQFGKLLGYAWGKSATVENGISGFKSTGITPFNPDAIPDYSYVANGIEQGAEATLSLYSRTENPCSSSSPLNRSTTQTVNTQRSACNSSPQPGCSHYSDIPTVEEDLTPEKLLKNILPIPKTNATAMVRKRAWQLAAIMNSSKRIRIQKNKINLPTKKQTRFSIQKKKTLSKHKNQLEQSSDSGSESSDLENVSCEVWNESECVGDYFETSGRDDWIKCVSCSCWFHDDFSKYEHYCDSCGKLKYCTN